MTLPGCCPALAEGRAEKFGAPDWCLGAPLVLPKPSLVRQSGALAVHHKMLPCPCGGQGNVSKVEAPCSKLGQCTRCLFFLVFLAPKLGLVSCFLMVPCSILVACMGDIFPLIFFRGEPDTALVEGRARFSSSWFQGTLLCSALVVGRAELPSLLSSLMLPS